MDEEKEQNGKTSFDPISAIEEMRANGQRGQGPRMTRVEQYQAMATLKCHFSHTVVGRMFGLSPASVSHLANCLVRRPGAKWRYPDVYREWKRLGEAEFLRAYMSEELWLKAKRIKYEMSESLDDRRLRGPNPRADGQSYDRQGDFEVTPDYRCRVDWTEGGPHMRGPIGWRFATIERDGTLYYVSREPDEEGGPYLPWSTSGDAFDAAYHHFDLPSPRRGRPKK